MKLFHFLSRFSVVVCFFTAMSSGNPIPTTPFSELQLINSLQWTVEVDCRNLGLYPALPAPGSTDTVTLNCSSSAPAVDSMPVSVIPERIDSNGIMLLTPLNFPGLAIQKGLTLFIGIKGKSSSLARVPISQTLTAQTSLVFGYQTNCCEQGPGGCTMTCSNLIYTVSSCPSIGVRNSSAYGSIGGVVTGKNGNALNAIRVYRSASPDLGQTFVTTNSGGAFTMSSLDLCHTYSLRFTDSTGTSISDTVVGPLQVTAGKTLTVNVHLNYLPASAVLYHQSVQTAPGGSVRILPSAVGSRIVLTVSGILSPRQGRIDLFSADGSLVRSIPFACPGPGTYTVSWDRKNDGNHPVPAGTYICRVRIGKDLSCKGFIIR